MIITFNAAHIFGTPTEPSQTQSSAQNASSKIDDKRENYSTAALIATVLNNPKKLTLKDYAVLTNRQNQ
jgi:hypothetical protein